MSSNFTEQYEKKQERLVEMIVLLSKNFTLSETSFENTPLRDSGLDMVGEVMRSLSRYIVAVKNDISPEHIGTFGQPPLSDQMRALKEPLLPMLRDVVEAHQRKIARGQPAEQAELHLLKAIKGMTNYLLPKIDDLVAALPPEEHISTPSKRAEGMRGALFAGITAAAGLCTRLMQDLRKDAEQGRSKGTDHRP